MLADIFLKDYKQLSAQGVKFTPADIVRLNALAVKVKLSAKPVGAVHLRRAVFWRDLVFREPTIGHEMWVELVGTYIDMSVDRNFRAVHAYALSREHTDLPDAYKPKACIKAVFDFAKRHLSEMTSAVLADVIDYALFGADWTACEVVPRLKPAAGEPEEPAALGVYIGAVARRINLTLDDAKRLTASEILEITTRADIMDRKYDVDGCRNAALAAYVRAREEIRNRSAEPIC